MKIVLASIIAPLSSVTAMFAAVAVLCAAAGPWLPERVVGFVSWLHRRRGGGEAGVLQNGSTWMLGAIRQGDLSLSWLSLAILCAAAGVVTLLTTFATGLFAEIHRFMLDHFFWTNLTLTAFEWMSVTLLVGVGWVLMGLIVSVLPAVARRGASAHREPPGVLSGCIVGLAVAWLLQHVLANRGWAGEQICLMGIVPLFVLAGVASRMSQRSHHDLGQQADEGTAAPEIQAGGEGLIGAGFLVWGVATAWIVGGWLDCLRIVAVMRGANPHAGQFFLVLGVSVAAASLHAHKRRQSTSGCGMVAWLAGAGAAVAATLLAFRPDLQNAQWWTMALLAVPLGYAVHYTMRAWLARSGSEVLGFELGIGVLLGGLGSGLILAQWWALPTFGPIGTICIASLLLMAFGGFVQIYEQDRSLRVRQQRLALVFGTLASVVVVFPADARRWGAVEKRDRMSADVHHDLTWLALGQQAPSMRMCLIGIDPQEVFVVREVPCAHIDLVPDRDRPSTRFPLPDGWPHVRIHLDDAFRTMRLVRGHYDLLYHHNRAGSPGGRFSQYSLEWFQRLACRASRGGVIYVDVPLLDLTPGAIAVITYTFEQAIGAPAEWQLVEADRGSALRLRGEPDRDFGPSDPAGPWSPVENLRKDESSLRGHSLRRDRLTATLNHESPMSTAAIERWLRDCRSQNLAGARSAN